jgi:xanthine dehydrogenase YagS FAD-binding subunit
MRSFEWTSPATLDEALRLLQPPASTEARERPQALAGGQDLLTVLNEGIAQPARIVNLKAIPGLDRIAERGKEGLELGALVTLADLAESPLVREGFPGLAEAARSVASPQIRNLATVGGNLCQRPRCWYFRHENLVCLKKGGNECHAASGENKYHAIFGDGPCHIVHPSDLAPMLVALGASATLHGAKGERTVPLERFFVLPSEGGIEQETVLEPGEILTRVTVPASGAARRSTYLKFRERESFDFAMVSVAAAIESGADGRITSARLVLGGVAPIPWKATRAEEFLRGQRAVPESFAKAADLALAGARPLAQNEYKVPLARTLVRRALAAAAAETR